MIKIKIKMIKMIKMIKIKEEITASSLKEETCFSILLIFVISCHSFHLKHSRTDT